MPLGLDGARAGRSGHWKASRNRPLVVGPSSPGAPPQPFVDHASLPNYASTVVDSFDSAHPRPADCCVVHTRLVIGAFGNDILKYVCRLEVVRVCLLQTRVRCASVPSELSYDCAKRTPRGSRESVLVQALMMYMLCPCMPPVAAGSIAVGAQLRLRKSQAPASPLCIPLFSHSPVSEMPWLVHRRRPCHSVARQAPSMFARVCFA